MALLKKYEFILTAYGLFFVYYMQGIAYPEGMFISQGVLLIYILLGIYCFSKYFLRTNVPTPVKLWTVFCIIQIITFLVSPKTVIGIKYEAIGEVKTFMQFKGILVFTLSLYIGLRIGRSNLDYSKVISWLGFIFLIIAVFRYFYAALSYQLEYGQKIQQNNGAYGFVTLIPFLPVMYNHYKKTTILAILVIVGFVIAGAKRGAILCLAVSALIAILIIIKNVRLNLKHVFVGFIAITALCCFATYKYQQSEVLQYRLNRMDKVGIGQREVAYKVLFDHWVDDTNLLTKLFGNGSAQSVSVWGNYAHNDWLEILIDNGLLSVIIYALFFISAFKYCARIEIDLTSKITCLTFLSIWFMQTVFSMGYTSIWSGLSMMLLGIIWGQHRVSGVIRFRNNQGCY